MKGRWWAELFSLVSYDIIYGFMPSIRQNMARNRWNLLWEHDPEGSPPATPGESQPFVHPTEKLFLFYG